MPEDDFTGRNKDRHLCRTCRYRYERNKHDGGICDYLEKTGGMRGCSPDDCNVYEPVRRRKGNGQ